MRAVLPETDPANPTPRLGEVDDPVPTAGEVLIEVRASALNRVDLMQARGLYPPPPGESEIPGLECAGLVAAVGKEVDAFAAGDRVMALLAGGGHAEKVAAPAGQVMPLPENLSFEQGAALPEVALTAWTNLVHEGGLAAGEAVLITGAASGVGSFTSQLAHELGARVLVAGRSRTRLEPLLELGADALVELGDGFSQRLREANGGDGLNLVLDLVGGEWLSPSLAALAPRGRLVLVGLMAGTRAEIDLRAFLSRRLRLVGSVLRSRSRGEKAELVAAFHTFAGRRLADGRLRPVLDRTLPFEDIAEAYRAMEQGGHFGKLVVNHSS